jgi:hypothetical protein
MSILASVFSLNLEERKVKPSKSKKQRILISHLEEVSIILSPVIPERYMEIIRDSKVMLRRWAKP